MSDGFEMNTEQLSQLIAAQGREALLERLRTAYTEAAAAHADIVTLDESRIEALVQNAAREADGLQWRRALAGVAARELGVSVAEALSHPAVVRAQTELGAPSYEESLTALITNPVPAPLPPIAEPAPIATPAEPAEPEPEALSPEPEAQTPDPEPPSPEAQTADPTPEPPQAPTQEIAAEPEPEPEPKALSPEPEAQTPDPEPPSPEPEVPSPPPEPAAAASSQAPEPDDASSAFVYDDGYEPLTTSATEDRWDDQPGTEPVPVIEGQLELAPEPDRTTSDPGADAAGAPITPVADDPGGQATPFEHARAEIPVTDDTLSDELEVIEADDTMVELLPEPEPVELDTQLYETVPLEADVVEGEEEAGPTEEPVSAWPSTTPPVLEAVPDPEPQTAPEREAKSDADANAGPAAVPAAEPEPAEEPEPAAAPEPGYPATAEHIAPPVPESPATAEHVSPPEPTTYAGTQPLASPPAAVEPSPPPLVSEPPLTPAPPVAPAPSFAMPSSSDAAGETPAEPEPVEPELAPAEFAPETGSAASAEGYQEPAQTEAQPAEGSGEVEELRIGAIHLGGVANLPTNREGLDLRLSSEGLDIMRGEDEIIGRLIWDEIEALEVPNQRRRRRNSQPAQARLVVRTRHGDASFEVPGYSSEELRDRVDLRLESYARR